MNKPQELSNKIDPLILVAQYEKEINRIQINHNQILNDLHKELEILRTKNRGNISSIWIINVIKNNFSDLLDELIIMNDGNYCCKHLEDLSYDILKSNVNDNQKPLSNLLNGAKIHQISTEDNKNDNYK